MDKRPNFIVVYQRYNSDHPLGGTIDVLRSGDEEDPYFDQVCRFYTAEEASEAGKQMPWANAWMWWVVELKDYGKVQYGPEAE